MGREKVEEFTSKVGIIGNRHRIDPTSGRRQFLRRRQRRRRRRNVEAEELAEESRESEREEMAVLVGGVSGEVRFDSGNSGGDLRRGIRGEEFSGEVGGFGL